MRHSIDIPIPFDLGHDELHLDPASVGAVDHPWEWLVYELSHGKRDEAEMERIMRSFVILYHHQHRIHKTKATMSECLDTAIIWERG
jgi:hypothetical protein